MESSKGRNSIKNLRLLVPLIALVALSAVACASEGQGGHTVQASQGNGAPLAAIEEIEVKALGSLPVEVEVWARGVLPDGCTRTGRITEQREANTFLLTVFTKRLDAAECDAGEIAAFVQIISLDVQGLNAGEYTVTVNGVSSSFYLVVDNVSQ